REAAAPRRVLDVDGPDLQHAALHEPGAGARAARRRTFRSLFARLHLVRDADRSETVHRGHGHGRDLQAHALAAAAARTRAHRVRAAARAIARDLAGRPLRKRCRMAARARRTVPTGE